MAKWRPDFQINGVSLPMPDGFTQTVSDLCTEETGRTLDGVFHKEVIAVKSSMPLKWSHLEWKTASQLAKATDGKNILSCKYMDVRKPYAMTQINMYVGERSFEPTQFDDDGKVYWSVQFSEIEI
ncbi:MAG: hypothetical protein NC311_08735 [Muribaculaceae bacterium]|nr:hypothetical protein [Muribaculaceae bacterium]MCM1399863.1 hypothetical protein [Clostridium sp.]MCM1460652.1 hypothetical protein [Bacteroides sp.]